MDLLTLWVCIGIHSLNFKVAPPEQAYTDHIPEACNQFVSGNGRRVTLVLFSLARAASDKEMPTLASLQPGGCWGCTVDIY